MPTNISSPELKANPLLFYARLRDESPVHCVKLPDRRTAWLVTHYDDAVFVLKDRRCVKDMMNALRAGQISKQPWVPGILKPLTRNMLDLDEPDHTRLRMLVSKEFTPGPVEQMRGRMANVVGNHVASSS